ncbi:MAG: alpha/beta hydrolase [Chitinophagales bacterium]|nr:alpha/beta hydrolase [Chitinophagales bacterium]
MKRLIITFSIVLLWACKKSEKYINEYDGNIPIVFVHGLMASGDTYEKQVKRFTSNGYSLDELYAYDYNSMDVLNDPKNDLNKLIDEVLKKTKAPKVNLVGHSLGSSIVYEFCTNPLRAAKVEHLVTLAGFIQDRPGGPSGEIPTLNIFSMHDKVVTGGGNIRGAENLKLEHKDHYEVATCVETFDAMYSFFNNKQVAKSVEVLPEDNIVLSGVAASFGENIYRAGTIVEIYEINSQTGFRLQEKPVATFQTNKKGEWGEFQAKPATYYEFVVYNTNSSRARKVHYYREPFVRSDKLVYLRTFPTEGLVSNLISAIPSDDGQSVVIFFGASQSVLAGRDQLTVDDYNYATNKYAGIGNTTIALFLFDDNKNRQSDFTSLPLLELIPFLNGADQYFQTETPATIMFEFNGRKLPVYNWKSKSEGVSVAVFE